MYIIIINLKHAITDIRDTWWKSSIHTQNVYNSVYCMLPTKCNVSVPNMYFNVLLTWVSKQKCLGIYIRCNFSNISDNERQIHSTYYREYLLISKFRKCFDNVRIDLFKSFCSNIYCSSLWSACTMNVMLHITTFLGPFYR